MCRSSEMRQWRALIAYRHQLVQRRTKIKNHIRDLLLTRRTALAAGSQCLDARGNGGLEAMGKPLAKFDG